MFLEWMRPGLGRGEELADHFHRNGAGGATPDFGVGRALRLGQRVTADAVDGGGETGGGAHRRRMGGGLIGPRRREVAEALRSA